MKKIVQGNDFRMRIPVFRIFNGEQVPFALPASEHIQVRLCGEYRRIDLEYEIDVTNDNVLVAKVDGRSVSCGCYGLEVRGVMFGQDWRSCEYEQIRIVHNNAEADTEFDYSDGEPSVEMDTALVILAADPDFYTKVEQAEQARVAEEKKRADAEYNRALAEGARSDMEVMREEAEAERITNEELRQTAETTRMDNEEQRIKDEAARVTNENARNESESARVSAETERTTAELQRGANEAQRKANENARASAEAERAENENTRKANETNRVAAEEIRITAEQNREIAEAQREANEEKRQEFFASVSKDMFVPVAQLPTEDIDPNTVYLLKDSSGKNGNLYSEYIYTDGAWEKIGSASVDIDGLLKEEDIATVNGQKLTNGGNILLAAETVVLDKEPTEGSVNGVTSGGVVDYMKPIYGEEIDINSMLVVAEKDYKWLHGVKTAASSYSIYEPISLKKGDIIKWDCPQYGVWQGMDIMGYMDGETYVPLVTLTGDYSSQYILQNDYDVIFCLQPNTMMTIKVTRNGKYEDEELTGRHYYAMELRGYTNTHTASVGGVFGWTFGGGSSYHAYRTVAIKVKAGERFVLNCRGDNYARTWVFVDNNNIIVDVNPNSMIAKDQELIIPEGVTWLICSQVFSRYGEGVVYKKTNYNQDDRAVPISDRYFWSSGKAVITKAVGEVCDYALSNNWSNGYTVITVAAGDEYSITLSQYEYPGYMVLNAARVVIASENPFEHPQYISGYKITIPEGGVFLVINKTSGSEACFRKLKDGRKKVKEQNLHKEGFLANMSRHISNVNDQSTWTKRLCMAWISDTHYDAWQYERFHDYIEANKAYIDAVLHTGDANRMSDTDKGFAKTLLEHRQTIPVVYAIGNHDAHGQTNGTQQALVSGDMFHNGTNYTQHFFDSNCVSTEDKCTYYRDFSAQKIRIISINDYAFPRYVDGNGWVTTTDETDIANATEWVSGKSYAVDDVVLYKGLYVKCTTAGNLNDDGTTWKAGRVPLSKYNVDCRYLTQEYVDFIINALNVEAGWSVILTAHQPFETSSNQEVANEAWQTAYQSFNVPTTKYGQNGYILQDILSAYIKRTAIEKTYSAIAPATDPAKGTLINDENIPDVTVSADFTLAKGSIIGFLNGHQHTDTCLYSVHMDEGIKLLCIGINTGCFCPIGQTGRFYSGDIVKGEDGTRDLFNVISFDTESKEIFLLRIGADVTENFTERKFARIKYTT